MTTDRLAGAALVLIGIVAIWESRAFPLGSLHRPGPAFMPVLLAILLILFGVAVAAMGAAAGRLLDVGWAAWGLDRLGYRVTMAVLLTVLFLALERLGVMASLVLTVGMAWGSFYLFDTLLKVPLPRGPFGL